MVKLIIDPGHGGTDAGAVAHNGETEKAVNLETSLYLKERLEQHGFAVEMTRTTDVTLGATKRTNIVKDSGADYCLSVHFNSFNGKADGAEVIHSIYNDGELAEDIMQAWEKHGQNRRRVFSRKNSSGTDYYYMNRMTGSVTTLILEPVFGDNVTDYSIYNTPDERQEFHEATIKGICEHFGIDYDRDAQVKKVSSVHDYKNHWAKPYIEEALEDGALSGRSEGVFDPNGKLTRAELAVFYSNLKELFK